MARTPIDNCMGPPISCNFLKILLVLPIKLLWTFLYSIAMSIMGKIAPSKYNDMFINENGVKPMYQVMDPDKQRMADPNMFWPRTKSMLIK